jgi:hypothetical protein
MEKGVLRIARRCAPGLEGNMIPGPLEEMAEASAGQLVRKTFEMTRATLQRPAL